MRIGDWAKHCCECNQRYCGYRQEMNHWSKRDQSLYGPYWWCEECCKEQQYGIEDEGQHPQEAKQDQSNWIDHPRSQGYGNTGWNYYSSAHWHQRAQSSWNLW